MIAGIGVDLCNVDRIKTLYGKYNDKFAHKILTESEFKQFKKRANPEHFLATRFAAKEAAVKALGTGFRDGIWFQSIEVTNDHVGKPILSFHDKGKEVCDKQNIVGSHLSISDEKTHVVAMVVLERGH